MAAACSGVRMPKPMLIGRSGRGNGKLAVIALHEPRQESVAVVHAADALQAQILDLLVRLQEEEGMALVLIVMQRLRENTAVQRFKVWST